MYIHDKLDMLEVERMSLVFPDQTSLLLFYTIQNVVARQIRRDRDRRRIEGDYLELRIGKSQVEDPEWPRRKSKLMCICSFLDLMEQRLTCRQPVSKRECTL
jgi:hypothetical protein